MLSCNFQYWFFILHSSQVRVNLVVHWNVVYFCSALNHDFLLNFRYWNFDWCFSTYEIQKVSAAAFKLLSSQLNQLWPELKSKKSGLCYQTKICGSHFYGCCSGLDLKLMLQPLVEFQYLNCHYRLATNRTYWDYSGCFLADALFCRILFWVCCTLFLRWISLRLFSISALFF